LHAVLRGLYPIVDVDALRARDVDVVAFAESILSARPPLLQLRAKSLGASETLALLRELVPRCRASGALMFANDRPDLAVLAGCDGVHVGQTDLPVAEVRRFNPQLKIGVSTHDLAQLREALTAAPDYVAFGPIFPTRSKSNPDPTVGLSQLQRASAECRAMRCSLVAIGGITLENAASVAPFAELAAVIAELLPDPGATALDSSVARARALHQALGGG
jgi:thiamine-phosphate pyrophosphorylase